MLLSHDHYDHMDLPTLRRLAREHRPTIYTGFEERRILAKHGIGNVVELDWWQEAAARSDMWITAVPAQHFSGRTPFDRDKRLWCGFVLQTDDRSSSILPVTRAQGRTSIRSPSTFRISISSILPIGAFRPEWFMGEVHMSPQDAVDAHFALGSRVSVASHFGTFALADDGDDEAVRGVERHSARRRRCGEQNSGHCGFGEGREVPVRTLAEASPEESPNTPAQPCLLPVR